MNDKKLVTFQATPEEIAVWDAAAEKDGRSRSSWIRAVLNKQAKANKG